MVCPAVADLTPWSIRLCGSFEKDEAERFAERASDGWEHAEEKRRSQNALGETEFAEKRASEKKNPARDASGVLEIEA